MKPSVILLGILLFCGVDAWAQSTRKPLFDFRKKADEKTKSQAVDTAKKIIEAVPDEVKNQAKDMITSPETDDLRKKALQTAGELMREGSGTSAAATAAGAEPPATTPAVAKPAVQEAPPPPTGPQARPLQPLNLDEAPAATKGQIVITAQKSAFFDANLGYGIYVGDVRARHPQMYIECEELELHMVKNQAEANTKSAPPAKDSDILAPAKKAEGEGPPIEKADARGPMVTVEKISEEGELQVGHCKHLIYDGKTGNTTLLIWPQVQIGNKLHKSTEPDCVMVIDPKGKLSTSGGNETIILQGEDATPKSRSGAAPAGSAPPQQ
ncbi:MAG: hypothetical protein R3F13_13605 [Prosthecobacter sp.]